MNGHNKLKKFFNYFFSLIFVLSSFYVPISTTVQAAVATSDITEVRAILPNLIIEDNEFTINYQVTCHTNKGTSTLRNIKITQTLPDKMTFVGVDPASASLVDSATFVAGGTGQKDIKINLKDITYGTSTALGGDPPPMDIKLKFKAKSKAVDSDVIGKYSISDINYQYKADTSAEQHLTSSKFEIDGVSMLSSEVRLKIYPKLKILYVHGENEPTEIPGIAGSAGTLDTRIDPSSESLSIQRFISRTLTELDGNYDLIYFGRGVYIGKNDDRNTGKKVANYDKTQSRFINTDPVVIKNINVGIQYDKNQTISSWDITEKLAGKVNAFIASGQPVIFNNQVFQPGTNFLSQFGSKSFQDNNLALYDSGKENIWRITGSLVMDNLFKDFGKTGKHRPYMNVTSAPLSTTLYSYNGDSTITYKVKCCNFNTNNEAANPIKVFLCLDKNSNGVFEYSPLLNTTNGEAVKIRTIASSDEQTISYPMPSEYMGGLYWKLVAIDANKQKSEAMDFFVFKGDPKNAIDIKILQVMPDTTPTSLKDLFDKDDTVPKPDGTMGKIGSWKDVFKLDVTAVKASAFNNNTNNCRSDLDAGKYNMLIMGFGDSYTKGFAFGKPALDSIQKFIDSKQGVMFAHDTMSGICNQEMKDAFLNSTGQLYMPTIYAAGPSSDTTAAAVAAGAINKVNAVGAWSASNVSLINSMRGVNYNFSDIVTQKVTSVNKGVITAFPYKLDTLHSSQTDFNKNLTLNISPTHIQYYRLDLEEADPWYNMCYTSCGTDPKGALDIDDSANTYYTYSYKNITFSGTGHSPGGYISAPDELKLFVNTILKTYIGGNRAPLVTITNPAVYGQKVPSSNSKVTFAFNVQDFDTEDSDKLKARISIARCNGDPFCETPSSFELVDVNTTTPMIDREGGDGIIDSTTDGVDTSTDPAKKDFFNVKDSDNVIVNIDKKLEAIPDGKVFRNFFLKVELTDGKKTVEKITKVVNYAGPMIVIKAPVSADAMVGCDKSIDVKICAEGENRIPLTDPDVLTDIIAKANIYRMENGLKKNLDSSYVDILVDKGATDGTMRHVSTLSPVTYNIVDAFGNPTTDKSSPKAKPDKSEEIWTYVLNFKKDGTYYVDYSPEYNVSGSAVTDQPFGSTTSITVITKPKLSYIKMMNKSLTYQEGQTAPDTVTMKIRFKLDSLGSDIKNCRLVLDRLKEIGAVDFKNDFTIETAKLIRKTGATIDDLGNKDISGKTVKLGDIVPIHVGAIDSYYELTMNIKGTRLSTDNFCGGAIILKEIGYDPAIPGGLDNGKISLVDRVPDPAPQGLTPGDLVDKDSLPPEFHPESTNVTNFTVYKVLNNQ